MRARCLAVLLVLLLAALLAGSQELPGPPEHRVRVGVQLVLLNVRVTAAEGGTAPILGAEDFVVLEDGKAQTVRFFENPQVRARIALVLDVSGSTREKVPAIRRATEEFLKQLSPPDEVVVFTVGPRYELVQDFTADRNQLVTMVRRLDTRPGSGTQLYDAVGQALQLLQPQQGRALVIIFSDGMDTNSALAFPDLRQRLLRGAGSVYAISLNTLEDERRRLEANLSRLPPEKRLVLVVDFTADRAEQRRSVAQAAAKFLEELPADVHADLLSYRPSGLRILATRAQPLRMRDLLVSVGESPAGRRVAPRLGQGPATIQHRGTGENIFVFTDSRRSGVAGLEAYLPLEHARIFPVTMDETPALEEGVRALVATSVGAEQEWRRDLEALPAFFAQSQERLRLLAEESGGRYLLLEDVERLAEAYKAVADELRGTYLLGYYTSTGPGYHRLHVTLAPPNLRVRSRTAFFVPHESK